MTAYTDDVTAGVAALRGSPLDEVERRAAVRAVLDAVAPQIAARALREAANDIYSVDDSSALAEPFRKWLRARAEQVSSDEG